MKIILTIVYSLGVVWNTLYIAYNVGKLPLLKFALACCDFSGLCY